MSFWQVLRKFFWIANLAFLTIAAYLTAGIVTSTIESRVVAAPDVNLEGITAKARASSRSYNYYRPILDRNIFDSSAVPMDEEDGGSDVDVSTLNVQLLGTIAGQDPETSFAIILDKGSNTADVYGVGDRISGATVKDIIRGMVTITRAGNDEVLTLPEITTATAPRRSHTPTGRANVNEYADGITQKGGNSFEIDKRVVDNALGDLSSLISQARIVPHMKDGEIDGFKVYNIKAGSLFKQLGLRNGDVLHNVNGMDISGPEQGLQAFQALRNESNIQIDISRRGSRKTLNYSIR